MLVDFLHQESLKKVTGLKLALLLMEVSSRLRFNPFIGIKSRVELSELVKALPLLWPILSLNRWNKCAKEW